MRSGTLILARGDNQTLGVTVTQPDGTPYNLSGASLTFQARDPVYFSKNLIYKSGNYHLMPESGISQFIFNPTDTDGLGKSKYFFDIKLLSTGSAVTTLMYGDLVVFPQ